MAAPTVNEQQPAYEENPRAQAVSRRIAELSPAPLPADGRLEAIALGLVDALLDADEETLRSALDGLRDARGRVVEGGGGTDPERERLLGWLAASTAFCHWALERATSESAADGVAGRTQAAEFLRALEGRPELGSSELRELLETDETQVSRTGRGLLEKGLVIRRKVGRNVSWQLSPRGRHALEIASAQPHATSGVGSQSFWREAIRRGFEGAGGDEPDERREVDPTRERIVESTLHLHMEKGIQATTWQDIATLVGLPVETVESYFPTQDDLVKSCGQHVFAKVRLPPPERAPEMFADASSDPERVRRLVDTLFGAYERAGRELEAARRERSELPLIDEALAEIDRSVGALVSEALPRRRADAASLASIQALTDVTVWRALRDQGASAEVSVEEASLAVERWLEARPAAA